MLETWSKIRRMRLYRCRLDMRACHPADVSTERLWRGFHAPPSGFHRRRGDHWI